ncbi:GPI mannosyltransferase 2 [Ampelomyces quisqualis]|uniref:GPI mannosyltransferase 2 n=1 Tax=Ampelomyces quisqualis TaxID=50730 RepID=A0A6A5Q913_AMPQU|nr:GPI mannosyltransferase 2 [Ampelomyces quisqualis]
MTANAQRKGHLKTLVLVFVLWKVLLLTLAAFCPGPGYDTSALILMDPSVDRHESFLKSSRPDRLTLNLFRWDALYFVEGAQRGKTHEQEWAFSWAYSWLLGLGGQLNRTGGIDLGLRPYIVAGIIISNACHLVSVFVLYRLISISMGSPHRYQIALVGSLLHIMTSASLFLSAPYTEAPFSMLNLTGMLLYTRSRIMARGQRPSAAEDAYRLGSGILFAAATLMRSNGLLSGLVLLYDVARYIPRVVSMQLNVHDVRRIVVTCMAGSIIAAGFVVPQYLAYAEFCLGEHGSGSPPWCMRTIPSIYSWVQSHYWNVGLFRYWTLPNVPLFLMAAPMLWLLLISSVTVLRSYFQPPFRGRSVPHGSVTLGPKETSAITHDVPELALPQLVLAVTATTTFHVQIVNRLASGYPTWYMMVATWLVQDRQELNNARFRLQHQWVVRGLLVYAMSQGILFANFLPPA